MGCCSVTQRHTGVDEVGPDEIELLELSGDNLGVWSLGETRLQLSVRNSRDELPPPPLPPPPHHPSVRNLEQKVVLWGRDRDELHHRIYSHQPIREWEGQPAHMYGEIIHSSLVSLYNSYTQETSEHFLVLFSFHLLILSLDHSRQDFIYEGILPLSGLSFQIVSLDPDTSHSPHMFEISSPMVDSKIFMCSSAGELQKWMQHIEDRRYKSLAKPISPSHCALSYLLPCDEHWKREELKKYLLQAPIWQWEGSPIQHMGQPGYISIVHVINTQRQGLQERLIVVFPQDLLLLSVDNKRLNIRYEGRLPRHSIKAVERSALPGRLEFELIGDMVEPLRVSCTCLEDYRNLMFQLQQPDRSSHVTVSPAAPPIMPKLQRSRKESQEPIITADQCHINGGS
ncbi:probable pleckstrin homology domain-containing family N member 1 [Etheostoma spectabile]|uniref:probable pleckstrin homology domain-containing family N member 1 n=1 Tax=Etheostoma spectabile TaxID=54343 RepID=UPI0013AFC5C8|nr:probable pleckstrin homology domain-containing family N member 1 [Etheostoma spectabile]XP_032376313.1 probable pleckstrin homology domain-containing family N member 1 [Etheostoma spectabile]